MILQGFGKVKKLSDVACRANEGWVSVTQLPHVNGEYYDIDFPRGTLGIDEKGVVRYFLLETSEGCKIYVLHPVRSLQNIALEGVDWMTSFLTAFGLNKQAKGDIYGFLSKALFPNRKVAIIKSWVHDYLTYPNMELGYHEVQSEALVWKGKITI